MLTYFLTLATGIELFFVPHTHCDPGWIETMDWYYIHNVRKIINNIVNFLEEESDMKMVWAETSYLKMWMDEQPQKQRDIMKELIKSGRIEIVGGGWVQNDEASPDIEMIIRQMEVGHEYLHEEFGIEKVRVGWQIDPFGSSAHNTQILAKFGFEFLVVNRIDVNFREQLIENADLEMIWKIGSQEVFLHILYEHYDPPVVLHWDKANCFDDGIPTCSLKLQKLINRRASAYKTDKIMILYGDDFTFLRERELTDRLGRLERIRDYINTSYQFPDLTVKIATASEYFDAVKATKTRFSEYKGDFLPYQNMRKGVPVYWTGYFTTRPLLKELVFQSHDLARASELALGLIEKKAYNSPEASLVTHHDAITGTCRNGVAEDYVKRINKENSEALHTIEKAVNEVLTEKEEENLLENPFKVLLVYNTLNWDHSHLVSLKSKTKFIEVIDWEFQTVISQSVPSEGQFDIYFKLKIPALSFAVVFIKEFEEACLGCAIESIKNNSRVLEDNVYKVQITENGFIDYIENTEGDVFEMNEEFHIYSGHNGGAYIYYPEDLNENYEFELEEYEVFVGPVVIVAISEWKRSISSEIFNETLILSNSFSIELKIGVFAEKNEEILVRFTNPDIRAKEWFFTSNSGDLRCRKFFECPVDRLGSNMYPIPGGLAVKGDENFLLLFSKFSIGAGMKNETSFELLLHRRLMKDDGFGLRSGLNDDSFVVHTFRIEFRTLNYTEFLISNYALKHSPLLFSLEETGNSDQNLTLKNFEWTASDWKDSWKYKSLYELGVNDPSVYLSSVTLKDDFFVFRIENLQNTTVQVDWENYELGEKMYFGGYKSREKEKNWRVGREIMFENKPETGKPVLIESSSMKGSTLGKYEIATFKVSEKEPVIDWTEAGVKTLPESHTFKVELEDQDSSLENFAMIVSEETEYIVYFLTKEIETIGFVIGAIICFFFFIVLLLYVKSTKYIKIN